MGSQVPLLNFEGGPGSLVSSSRVPGSWSHFYTMPYFYLLKNIILYNFLLVFKMSKAFNVSLKVTFTKIWPSQDFDFLSLKNLTPGLGANVRVIFVLKKLWRFKIKKFLLIGNWVKLWRVGAKERKKKTFLVPFTLSEGKVFNMCFIYRYSALRPFANLGIGI